jgi:hypothetical protein
VSPPAPTVRDPNALPVRAVRASSGPVPAEALRPRSVPFRASLSRRTSAVIPGLPLKHCCLAELPFRDAFETSLFLRSPFRIAWPEGFGFAGRTSESGLGIGLRLCLALLPPSALSLALQPRSLRISAAPRWSLPGALIRFRPLLPTARFEAVTLFRVAPSGICLWINRIMGITFRRSAGGGVPKSYDGQDRPSSGSTPAAPPPPRRNPRKLLLPATRAAHPHSPTVRSLAFG